MSQISDYSLKQKELSLAHPEYEENTLDIWVAYKQVLTVWGQQRRKLLARNSQGNDSKEVVGLLMTLLGKLLQRWAKEILEKYRFNANTNKFQFLNISYTTEQFT